MALSWADQIARGGLRVKGARATTHQAQMMWLIVTETRKRGGDLESMAGAVATAIQESNCTNMSGGDRDSQGLYQQRPSMGWGTVAQIREPKYAIKKFLDQFLAYRRKGQGWLTASHNTQRSAFPSAPAKWYGEGVRAGRWFAGAGADASVAGGLAGSTVLGSSAETRVQPYEFSRGSADKPEDSWTCLGRLAQEVGWRRFMRRGRLWFVSENWLNAQPTIYTLGALSQGVIELDFEWETRTGRPAEATMKAIARRYQFGPGDTINITDAGPGSGRWIITSVRRTLGSPEVEVSLKRPTPKMFEPAPQTTTQTSIKIGTSLQSTGSGDLAGADQRAARAYQQAQSISDRNIPYSQTINRTIMTKPPAGDCSSSCSIALWAGGIPLPKGVRAGGYAPVSGDYMNWGQPGKGKFITVYCNRDHIWLRWTGLGRAWRFDTSSYGSGGGGPKQRFTPRPTSGFAERHWPGL